MQEEINGRMLEEREERCTCKVQREGQMDESGKGGREKKNYWGAKTIGELSGPAGGSVYRVARVPGRPSKL